MSRILLVDDEADVRESVGRILTAAGHDVQTAADGGTAWAACEQGLPDLVITDLVMPRTHGIELIEKLRKAHPSLPILAISGGGNFWPERYQPDSVHTSSYLSAAVQVGATASLDKPFSRAEILEIVGRLLSA